MTNYTKNIYYGLCSITSNYEFFIDNSPPTICPYHGGSITGIPIVSDTGKIYKIQIINNNFTNFNSSSYSKVLVLSLKGIRDSVLREINLISNKKSDVTSYDIRIFDITNNKMIIEKTLLNNDNEEIINISENDINNLPYDAAIIELQVKATSNKKNKYVYVSEIEFIYEKL